MDRFRANIVNAVIRYVSVRTKEGISREQIQKEVIDMVNGGINTISQTQVPVDQPIDTTKDRV